jgi:hypothetical protein
MTPDPLYACMMFLALGAIFGFGIGMMVTHKGADRKWVDAAKECYAVFAGGEWFYACPEREYNQLLCDAAAWRQTTQEQRQSLNIDPKTYALPDPQHYQPYTTITFPGRKPMTFDDYQKYLKELNVTLDKLKSVRQSAEHVVTYRMNVHAPSDKP